MTLKAKFAHTNIIARDWKRLSKFYEQVFGCIPLPPERELEGQWLDQATGITNVQIHGIHLRLPGHGDQGPTLEIFQYNRQVEGPATGVNRPGFGHIAFAVDDVEAARDQVLASGGGRIGNIACLEIPEAGRVTFVYLTDPEGNIIELQKWEKGRFKRTG
ncbi:MAG: VOC family protein [Candidatus Zixiibacteriota bacterium]